MLVQVPLLGVLTWQLVFNYDNSNNSATIEHSIRTRKFQSISMSTFREEITQYAHHQARSSSRTEFEASAAYQAVSVSFDTNFEFSEEVSAFVLTTREQKDVRKESEYEETRKYAIGPHSSLELYQLYFKAPGISYACNAVSTVKKPDDNVVLQIMMKPMEFISGLRVVYGSHPSQAPPDRVREVGGLSDDINSGYGGDYVWLVPEYTSNVEDAVTGFDLFIQDSGAALPDLAKGAGGHFRYLVPVKNCREKRKLTEVSLMRRKDGDLRGPGPGFIGRTSDLNRHRGGDWLYVVAKEIEV